MHLIPYLIILGISCFVISCTTTPSTTVNSTKQESSIVQPSGIRAILSLKDSVFSSSMDAYVEATILNHSATNFKSSQAEISQAILALQVFNAEGIHMLTIPPSTPPKKEDEKWIIIKPSEAFLTTYDLHIFSPPLPKGSYSIKMKNILSNRVFFTIE